MFSLIPAFFPDITPAQEEKFRMMQELYTYWNERINVISRKDMGNFYLHHVLHSLGIAKVIRFVPGTSLMDLGTGGGFPGIPLAIMFPDVHFHLVDSIGKKIKVVEEVARSLNLNNVEATVTRAESLDRKYDFIVSRAVTTLSSILDYSRNKILPDCHNELKNGILYLKGGDIDAELDALRHPYSVYDLKDYFGAPFFETKKVVHISLV